MMPKITIYTDGSCLKNPGGPGGIGAIILADGKSLEISKGFPVAEEFEFGVSRLEELISQPLRGH